MEKNNCSHAYCKPAGFLWWCFDCKSFFKPEENKKSSLAKMPPVIFRITERLWEEIAPWPLMPFKVVKKYGWYISILQGFQYLIMPITRNGKPAFYSARLLEKNTKLKKYDYPYGVSKEYWLSDDQLESPVVFFGEGVADAAYMSQLGSSVGLLGNYYNGTLDAQLAGKTVVIVLDSDVVGFTSAVRISCKFSPFITKILMLPEGCDPTDIKLPELRKRVRALGVKL